jgi:hypothetical protein
MIPLPGANTVSRMSNLHSLTADERAETAETELAYVMDLNRSLLAACLQAEEYLTPLIGSAGVESCLPLLGQAIKWAQDHNRGN